MLGSAPAANQYLQCKSQVHVAQAAAALTLDVGACSQFKGRVTYFIRSNFNPMCMFPSPAAGHSRRTAHDGISAIVMRAHQSLSRQRIQAFQHQVPASPPSWPILRTWVGIPPAYVLQAVACVPCSPSVHDRQRVHGLVLQPGWRKLGVSASTNGICCMLRFTRCCLSCHVHASRQTHSLLCSCMMRCMAMPHPKAPSDKADSYSAEHGGAVHRVDECCWPAHRHALARCGV